MKSLDALAGGGPRPCPSCPHWWSSSSSLWSEHANIMQSSGFITAGEDGGRRISALIHGLIPAPCVKMWTAGFCFLCFFYRHFSKELGKQLIRIKTDLSTALIASSLGAKPITASRARLWPRVWFIFTVNWKQSKGARLPPVCMLSGCRVGFFVQRCRVAQVPLFFLCRWIEAARCVSWSPSWKSWEEAGLAGGGNENVRWPASIQLYKLMVSMKCQSKLLNQEGATRLVVLQSPPLPPLLLDGNLLKAENTWWVTTGQTQWG